jgi:hypothetical protein
MQRVDIRKLLILRMAKRAKSHHYRFYCTKCSNQTPLQAEYPTVCGSLEKELRPPNTNPQHPWCFLTVWECPVFRIRPTPLIQLNLFSRKSSSPDLLTCSTTGLTCSHCSCRLRSLSHKTINPGWTADRGVR